MTTPGRSVPPTIMLLAVLLVRPAEATAELSLSLGIVRETVPGFDARSGDDALDVHLDRPTMGHDDGGMVARDLSVRKSPGTSPPVIESPVMGLSVITPSGMVISSWGLPIMITTPLGVPPALSCPFLGSKIPRLQATTSVRRSDHRIHQAADW
jgi:hypothetical protein